MIKIVQAQREVDHDLLCYLARKSKYISSFSSMMFSSEAAYEKGWIRMAIRVGDGQLDIEGEILGFTCVRHKTRTPETMLYFLMVDPSARREGVGRLLMEDLEAQTPHPKVVLKVMKDNEGAVAFYESLDYKVVGEAYDGKGLVMEKVVSR